MAQLIVILDAALSAKNGLFLNYIGTLLVASSTAFNPGVRFGDYSSVMAVHPNFFQWGMVLIGLGFILQFLEKASRCMKIIYVFLLFAPFILGKFLS